MDPSHFKYPLPDSRLPRVLVDDDTIARWTADAQQAIQRVLLDRSSWFYLFNRCGSAYKLVFDKRGTKGFARVSKNPKRVEFMCRAELQHLCLDDIIYGLQAENTAQQRALFAQLYQSLCVDGAILELFQSGTVEDAFHAVAIKWLAFTTPMKQLIAYSDYIYFEYSCTTQDADGRTVLVQYKITPTFAPGELYDHGLDMNRSRTYTMATYHMENGVLLHHAMGEQETKNMPSWVSMRLMPTILDHALNHYGLMDARALHNAGVTVNTLAPYRIDDGAMGCRVCKKRFGFTRRKKWCRACGHTVCRACVIKLILLKPGVELASRLPFVSERFCLNCILYAREMRFRHDLSASDNSSLRFSDTSRLENDSFFGGSPLALATPQAIQELRKEASPLLIAQRAYDEDGDGLGESMEELSLDGKDQPPLSAKLLREASTATSSDDRSSNSDSTPLMDEPAMLGQADDSSSAAQEGELPLENARLVASMLDETSEHSSEVSI